MSCSTRAISRCAPALVLALFACQGIEAHSGAPSGSAGGAPGSASGTSGTGSGTSGSSGTSGTGGANTGGTVLPFGHCSFYLTPAAIDFGSVDVGQSSKPTTVVLENLGAVNCLIDSIAVTYDATASFRVLTVTPQPDPALGVIVVSPGTGTTAQLTAELDFAPTNEPGPFTGKLSISIRDPSGIEQTPSVQLTGNAPGPDQSHCLVVAPPEASDLVANSQPDAGELCSEASRMLTLFNQCSWDIALHSIEIDDSDGGPAPQFALSDPPALPQTLMAGGNLSVEPEFEPTQPGTATATASLVISWGPAGTPEIVVPLSGQTLPPPSETDTFTATDVLTYDLIGAPIGGAGGMSVTIGATHVPSLAGTATPNWTYDGGANAVTFTPRVYLRAGQMIAVTYPIGCK